jgi:hypothetical protein
VAKEVIPKVDGHLAGFVSQQVTPPLRLVFLADSNLIRQPIADKTSMTVPILGFLPLESAL